MADPTFLVVFEEGQQALYYDQKSITENRQGVKVQKILLVPTKEIISAYGLTEKDLDQETYDGKKAMWKEYPINRIRWLRRTKSGAIIWAYCTWDGRPLSYPDREHELMNYIEALEKEIDSLIAENSTLHEQRKYLTSSQIEEMKRLKQLQDATGDSKPSDDDEDFDRQG